MKERSPYLTGPRVTLSPLVDGDREALLRMARDERVTRMYMMPDLEDEARAEAFFLRMQALSRAAERFVWGIHKGGELIGFLNECGVEGDSVEIGYFVDPAHWNQGYATEAFTAAIRELFRMGYRAVTAGYFEENPASRRVMEKCGLTPLGRESVIAYRGTDHRCLYMGIRAGQSAPSGEAGARPD